MKYIITMVKRYVEFIIESHKGSEAVGENTSEDLENDINGILVELGDVGFDWELYNYNCDFTGKLSLNLFKKNGDYFNFSDIYDPLMMLNDYIKLKFKKTDKYINLYYELIFDRHTDEYYEYEINDRDIEDFHTVNVYYYLS